MRLISLTFFFALGLLIPVPASAQEPASVLIFPNQPSSADRLTLTTVTNSDSQRPITAFFHYINAIQDPDDPLFPRECQTFCRPESLTPADTITVLTTCHNAGSVHGGYLVVSARDPATGASVSHDYLIGSSLVVHASGVTYTLGAYGFRAIPPKGSNTDLDFDGKLDFDDIEYEKMPSRVHLDSFLGLPGSRLTLVNFSGDPEADVSVYIAIWNDNERAMSLSFRFRCWFEIDLTRLSGAFSQAYLHTTDHDPQEIDLNCDRHGDLQAGWARFTAISARRGGKYVSRPPILGALVPGPYSAAGAKLLWGDPVKQDGEF